MRLLTRIMIYYVLISLVIFSAGGYAFYVSFRKEIYEELDEQMRDEKKNIERQLDIPGSVPTFITGVNFRVSLEPYSGSIDKKFIERKDTVIYHPYEGKIPFRQWRFYASGVEQNYQVTIRKSLIDIEDLSEVITAYLIYGFFAFLMISLAVNYLVLKRILRPFNLTLDKMRSYGLHDSALIKFNSTNTKEFNELNEVLMNMSKRIHDDYLNVKQYTENASHEIQTPLAIINSKIELLMQNENLDEKQAELLESAYEATNRLYRLNQSLIILSRIENREFHTESIINMSELLYKLFDKIKDQFELKGISVSVIKKGEFMTHIHPTLAEILLQNLLSNAMRYTPVNGNIIVENSENAIQISNSGSPLPFPPEKIFKRFVRSNTNVRSLGIGLSLVKKIVDVFSLQISYNYSEDKQLHIITLKK